MAEEEALLFVRFQLVESYGENLHTCVSEKTGNPLTSSREKTQLLTWASSVGTGQVRPSTCICSRPDDMCSYCLSKRKTGPYFPHFSHEELQGHDRAASEISPGGVI